MDVNDAFLEAGDHFAVVLDDPRTARTWKDPSALDGLTVGALAAHAVQGVVWLDRLLDVPEPGAAPVVTLGEYLASFRMSGPGDFESELHRSIRAVAERGGQRTPEETAAKLRTMLARLRQRLDQVPGDRLLDMRPSLPWSIRLEDRVRVEVLELVLHSDDLAVSIGLEDGPDPPDGPVHVAVEALLAAARVRHGHRAVLRALARRERSGADVFPVL